MTFTENMKAELAKPLDKKNVKPPAPGKYGEYVEGWKVIEEANRIFGFDGWSRETVEIIEVCRYETEVGRDKKPGWAVGYRAKVRVVAHGVTREGSAVGNGVSVQLYDAIESAAKEAETDAMKRALMTFGYPFGLALYDKSKANVGDPLATATDLAVIRDMAGRAGIAETDICAKAKIITLEQLPESAVQSVMNKLQLTIDANKTRTPVDAG